VNPDFDFARKSTATPRNPAKSNTGFRPLLPAAQALSEFFTIDYVHYAQAKTGALAIT
jgi:hypothetical protein